MAVRKRVDPVKGGVQEKWLIDVTFHHPDGSIERCRKLSPVQTKRGAEQYEREVRESLLAKSIARRRNAGEKHEQVLEGLSPRRKAMPKLKDFAKEFMENHVRPNNKPSEVYGKTMVFKNHLIPTFGAKDIDKISVRDIEAFKAGKLKQGLSPKTVNNILTVLGATLKAAKSWGIVAVLPEIRFLRLPILEHTFLSYEQAERLIEGVDADPFRTMVVVALRTGLRLGELRALRWQDVDLGNSRLIVRRAAWRDQVGPPKNGRAREVALSNQALAALSALRTAGQFPTVFSSPSGQMLTKGACRWPLWRGSDAAGIGRRIGWHILRHTFASHLVMRGAALKVIQELLGHSDIKMTMRYAHLTPQVRQEAVQLLDSCSNAGNRVVQVQS